MRHPRLFWCLTIVLLALTACQAAPSATGDATALEARIAALEAQMNGAGVASTADVADVVNRLSVLEAQSAMGGDSMGMDHGGMDHGDGAAAEGDAEMEHGGEPMTEGDGGMEMEHGDGAMVSSTSDPLFAVTMAAYMMDTAGFHGMDDAINGTNTIDEGYVTTVDRVARLMEVTPWAPELAEEAMSFRMVLGEFSAALASGDVEAVKPLATEVHNAQHDFSHNVGEWINAQLGIEGSGDDHSH